MPCVFPVLSLKVLGFATHHDSKSTLHREAFAFAGGVVLTFVLLGLVLAALRAAGEQLGWGFQLQSPAVVTALAVLAVPTIMAALAPTLGALIFWRFVQGLVLPPIFAVTIAYIGEEFPPREATGSGEGEKGSKGRA